LSYTSFAYSDLKVSGGETLTASFTVTHTGKREGTDVPQLYLTDAPGEKRLRLLGFERVQLRPGASCQVTVTADPRLLARFDDATQQWRIDAGVYAVALSRAADAPAAKAEARLVGRSFGP
jgi:beta-glucosidase